MPRERLSMRKIRDVLRLKHECQLVYREIAHSCGLARSTVSDYLTRAAERGSFGRCLPPSMIRTLNPACFTVRDRAEGPPAAPADYAAIDAELRQHCGLNLTLICSAASTRPSIRTATSTQVRGALSSVAQTARCLFSTHPPLRREAVRRFCRRRGAGRSPDRCAHGSRPLCRGLGGLQLHVCRGLSGAGPAVLAWRPWAGVRVVWRGPAYRCAGQSPEWRHEGLSVCAELNPTYQATVRGIMSGSSHGVSYRKLNSVPLRNASQHEAGK